MKWSKLGTDGWTAREGVLTVAVKPKGDGRWTWDVHKDGTPNPMALGVSSSLGAAKRTAENYVERGNLGC